MLLSTKAPEQIVPVIKNPTTSTASMFLKQLEMQQPRLEVCTFLTNSLSPKKDARMGELIAHLSQGKGVLL